MSESAAAEPAAAPSDPAQPTSSPTAAVPLAPVPPPEVVPAALPAYDFVKMANRSRVWRLIPGWRLSRNGNAGRPDRATVRSYARVFVARLRVKAALLTPQGLPKDKALERLVILYADAVHGRIHWYEKTLQERNFWYQLFRVGTYVLIIGAVGLTFRMQASEAQLGYITAVGVALSNFAHFVLTSRNEQAQIEAYVAALAALKKQLYEFENAWDDVVGAAAGWPPGFAVALAAGPDEAAGIEEIERLASLRALVGGSHAAFAATPQWESSIKAVATARAGVAPKHGLSELQKAELDVEAARSTEARARAEDWGVSADTVLQAYRQARIEAETRAERLRREDVLLSNGRG